jgi:membrane-associated protease RseP (regulator of RpoE activity)
MHGQDVLEKISRNRRFWRGFGEFSIWLCLLAMLGVLTMIVNGAIETIKAPPEEYLPASDLLLIPGVNSFVPFWWPVLALIFALVIHEYSHGIQARAHGMRIRSFGLLLAGPIPVGAFAEPQMHEMVRAPRRERIRLYAAGPSINIIATYLALIMLSGAASGLVAGHPGVYATGVIAEEGAEEGGLLPYEIIIRIEGVRISDHSDFSEQMDLLSSGEEVTFTKLSHPNSEGLRTVRDISVTLGDRYQYYIGLCEGDSVCVEETEIVLAENGIETGDAFLGVSGLRSSSNTVDGFSSIVSGDYDLRQTALATAVAPLLMIGIPIQYDGQTMLLEERAMLQSGDGAVASALGTDGMLMLFDFLFWLVWINFLLGFANLIPMIPFDGGHIVKDGVHSMLDRLTSGVHPMRVEAMAERISSMSTFLVLFIVIVPIILPRLV